jgi:integrase/recombinase XerD
MNNSTLINQFLDHYWLSSGASQNTLSAYRSDLKLFANWFDQPLTNVSDQTIKNYFEHRQLNSMSTATQARILTCLRAFYLHLLTSKIINQDPTAKLHHPKQAQKLPIFLNIDEVDQLLSAPDQKNDFWPTGSCHA